MNKNSNNLKELVNQWKEWSLTADKNEDGWQSDFPKWVLLMSTAELTILLPVITSQELDLLEFCWEISEESEYLRDHAEENILNCFHVLERMTSSKFIECRWQVYDVLSYAGKKAESILRKGFSDSNEYVRRRAIISLARLAPDDADSLALSLCKDIEPYIRQASIEMAISSNNYNVIKEVCDLLLKDPVEHIRLHAERTVNFIANRKDKGN